MIKWIVRNFIAFSEVTGRPVPRIIRKLVPADFFTEESKREQELSEALHTGVAGRTRMPDSLVEQLDQALAGEQGTAIGEPEQKTVILPAWALSFAALIVISLSVFIVLPGNRSAETVELVEPVPEVNRPRVEQVDPSHRIPSLLLQSVEQDLVFKPMQREKERLTSDLTNAIQYMADSFLPDTYATRVNENLDSLKGQISSSI